MDQDIWHLLLHYVVGELSGRLLISSLSPYQDIPWPLCEPHESAHELTIRIDLACHISSTYSASPFLDTAFYIKSCLQCLVVSNFPSFLMVNIPTPTRTIPSWSLGGRYTIALAREKQKSKARKQRLDTDITPHWDDEADQSGKKRRIGVLLGSVGGRQPDSRDGGGCWLENSELFTVVDVHGKWRTLYVVRRLRDMSKKRAGFKGLPRLSARWLLLCV